MSFKIVLVPNEMKTELKFGSLRSFNLMITVTQPFNLTNNLSFILKCLLGEEMPQYTLY